MLGRASTLKEETCHLEEEAQWLETEGLGKLEAAVAGSEAEGFYRLLRGAIAHPPISSALPPSKKVHHTPSATVSHLPHQESTGPKVSKPTMGIAEQELEAALPASEEALPAHMQPLCIQLGASRECTEARLKVAKRDHQPHMPQSACMCTNCTWGGVGVSLLLQIVLQPRHILMPQEESCQLVNGRLLAQEAVRMVGGEYISHIMSSHFCTYKMSFHLIIVFLVHIYCYLNS